VQKIGKIYLFHGKLLLNLCLGLGTPQKMLFYACFMPQNRPMPEKMWAKSVFHLSLPLHFAHIQVGVRAGVGSGGKSTVSTKQGKNLFTAKMRLFIY
jgi:hypothetical protein